MSPLVVTLIILAVLAVILIGLYVAGTKMQKKQMEQKEQMMAAAQTMSMLIIDKKMMKMKEAGLPKMVMEQTPKRFHNAKMPIVKVKAGPQIMNLICDDGVFDELPTKGEVKVLVSGIYIVGVKSIRGKKKAAEDVPQKKGFAAKLRMKQRQLQKEYEKEEKAKTERKAEKEEQKARKEKAKKITK